MYIFLVPCSLRLNGWRRGRYREEGAKIVKRGAIITWRMMIFWSFTI